MKLSLFCFCLVCFFEKPLKDFPFFSPILLTPSLVQILTKMQKESCMYHSSQLFFKTLYKTLKFQEKSGRVGEKELRKVRKSIGNAFSSNL